jgi:phenylacetate-CoA ligase
MTLLNLRKQLLITMDRIRGFNSFHYYQKFQREDQRGIHPDTTKRLLIQILTHCQRSVSYYRDTMRNLGRSFEDNPFTYLQNLPILTKDIIRSHFDELKSNDLNQRKWRFGFTGGSTGESLRFIYDAQHAARASAVATVFSKLIGKDQSDSEIFLWASPQDIRHGTKGWKAYLASRLGNYLLLDVTQMTPERMKDYIALLNAKRPKLIEAYADALYELARFAEREHIEVIPQNAIITSAAMLHPYMREEIEKIFQCPVFNRYGSREFGTVACERPGLEGLWVPPWTIYIEIVDNVGNPVPIGTEGDILVTSLTNYAMPFVRYRIGDRGVLSSRTANKRGIFGQVLEEILGRDADTFKTKKGALVHPSYFAILLYFRDWIKQYQVIQKGYSSIIFRLVKSGAEFPQKELNDLTESTRMVMGEDCEVNFEFVDEILASNSGKFRFLISEVAGR